ncbi:MAG: UDP-N-acetylmuramoyl-L-alanine--D-glutamate ligase, partial [Burkholderiales bacterium]|nr:UDP-N-acetylmuramoyl-L-alanine--D-glutamate ligase [Burkholderiales bacterium]
MNGLDGQTVLVLGLGHSGLAMARWCAAHGAAVRWWDSRAEPPQAGALREAVPQAQRIDGALDETALAGVQRLLKSPGLAPHDPAIAPLLQAARTRGVVVQGELALFTEALAALRAERGYAPQLLAVTGTNGKTTTTALAAKLVARTGRRVASAGNIGPTLLDTLAAALEADEPLPEVWVLELSSFQLDGSEGFEPDAAAVLNLTQDHLDWHGDMAAYAAAKARIFGPHTVRVLNRDDPVVRELGTPLPAARKPRGPKPVPPRIVSF